MRGRLIQRFKAVYNKINQADYVAPTNIDPILGTPVIQDSGRFGEFFNSEEPEILIPCQIFHNPEKTVKTAKGIELMPDLLIIHHYKDLELMGLLNSDNNIDLRLGDRLTRLETTIGNIVKDFSNEEMYIINI